MKNTKKLFAGFYYAAGFVLGLFGIGFAIVILGGMFMMGYLGFQVGSLESITLGIFFLAFAVYLIGDCVKEIKEELEEEF